jgi:thiol-disulfide isomerase/thioredoxin
VLLRLEAAELRLAGESDEDQLGITPDTPAPDFLVSDATGAAVTLADLLAPELPVLLVFTSPTCGPCHELLPDVARWQREHGDRLTIAVVNGGDVDAAHAEAAEHELQHVLVDHELALYEAYGANGTPSAALVSPDGMLASWIAAGAATIEELMQESLRAQWTRQDEEGLAVGTPAPELDLTGLDGDRVSLSDPNGRDTLVLFWNPDCGFCRDMHEDLLHWERKAPAESPRVLVVSAGDEESTRAEGFSSTIVLDPEFSVGEPFGATGTPMAVLVDREGRIGSALATGKEAVLGLAGAT